MPDRPAISEKTKRQELKKYLAPIVLLDLRLATAEDKQTLQKHTKAIKPNTTKTMKLNEILQGIKAFPSDALDSTLSMCHRNNQYMLWAFLGLVFIFQFILTVFPGPLFGEPSTIPSDEVVFLLWIPVVLQAVVVLLVGPGILRGFYSIFGLGLGILPLQFFWWRFLNEAYGDGYSTWCLIFTFLLVLVASIVAWMITRQVKHPPEDGVDPCAEKENSEKKELTNPLSCIREHLAQKTPSAIFFFLGLFLCVTCLISFSLAFHDRGLWEEDPPDLALYAGPIVPPLGTDTLNARAKVWRILFDLGAAKLDLPTAQGPSPTLEQLLTDPITEADRPQHLREHLNRKSLNAILEYVRELEQNNKSERIRITLIGHADNTDLNITNNSYRSNYELSEARTDRIHRNLIRLLAQDEKPPSENITPYNTEWLPSSISNEDDFRTKYYTTLSFPEDEYKPLGVGDRNKIATMISDKTWPDTARCVEVIVKRLPHHPSQYELLALSARPKKLTLLDYVYFTTYTITTTGYGDIQPVSPRAKFISSLANILELFFLVVFFNALLAHNSRRRERRTKKNTKASDRLMPLAPVENAKKIHTVEKPETDDKKPLQDPPEA